MDLQLLVVLVFVAMSIADALGRRRKKRDRMEEMDREEREEQVRGAGAQPGTTAQRSAPSTGAGSGTESGSGQDSRRETADSMIPDDLWTVLTGGAPPPRRESPPAPKAPAPSSESGQSRAEREFEELTTQPWRPGPTEEVARPSRPTSHPSRPTPVPSASTGPKPRPPASPGAPRKAPTPYSAPQGGKARTTAPSSRFPSRTPASQGRARSSDSTEVPWRGTPDITSGEIGSVGGTRLSPLRREIGGPATVERRGGGTSTYVSALRSEGRDGLRKAIVFQEVLGPPVTLRPAEKRVWEAWEE
jgi:hypothetical protein